MHGHALMFNWIGEMPDRAAALAVDGVHWHDYGKAPRPGRKIGHATVTAASREQLMARAERIARIAGGRFADLIQRLD
jgi:5-(carboxyamino)imidazole ribonucleotide synthase